MLQADDFPSFYANLESLRQLTFNGVELNLPLKTDGEGGERYSVDEYLGTAWGAGDAVIKDEVADFFFCKALAHFLDSRYRKNKGAPRQGSGAPNAGLGGCGSEQTRHRDGQGVRPAQAGGAAGLGGRARAQRMPRWRPCTPMRLRAAPSSLAALSVLAPQLVELRRRLVAAAASAPYNVRDVVEEQRGGTKVEVDQGGWFRADGSVKSGTVIMVAFFKLDALSGAIPELSKGLGQILSLAALRAEVQERGVRGGLWQHH